MCAITAAEPRVREGAGKVEIWVGAGWGGGCSVVCIIAVSAVGGPHTHWQVIQTVFCASVRFRGVDHIILLAQSSQACDLWLK